MISSLFIDHIFIECLPGAGQQYVNMFKDYINSQSLCTNLMLISSITIISTSQMKKLRHGIIVANR